jgi:hypothetical protein
MRMYELWRLWKGSNEPERLEDEGGPVLFARVCDAESLFRAQHERGEADCRILPVTVGLA